MTVEIAVYINNKGTLRYIPPSVLHVRGDMPMNSTDPTSLRNNNQRINVDSVFALL